MHGHDRTGHGVEAGGEDDDIDVEAALAGRDAVTGDPLDRLLPQIDQRDVVPVVGGVVVGVETGALGAKRMVVRRQRFRRLRIVDDLADLFANQVGDAGIALDVYALVGPKLGQDVDEITHGPGLLEALAPLRLAELPAYHRLLRPRHACERPARLLAVRAAVAFKQRQALRRCRTIMGWQRKIRRALEDRELRRLLGEHRNRLNSRRPRTDHRDALAAEVDLFMRPAAGEIDLALEVLDAIDLRRLGRGKTTRGHDVVAAGYGSAIVHRELPTFPRVVPCRGRDFGVEANVGPQVIAIGDKAKITQDFGLGRVFFRPRPCALELRIEGVAVIDRLNVAACAGISVPVPGAADVAGFLQHDRVESGLAQPMQKVKAGETGAYDRDIDLLRCLASCFCTCWTRCTQCIWHATPPAHSICRCRVGYSRPYALSSELFRLPQKSRPG